MTSTLNILDPSILGKKYLGSTEIILPQRIRKFAKATNETNEFYFMENIKDQVVPPLFPVTMMFTLSNNLIADSSLNLDISRMVHGEHEIIYYKVLKPMDAIITSVELESIDVKPSGEVLWVRIDGHRDAELVFQMRAGLFFRAEASSLKKDSSSHNKRENLISSEKIIKGFMRVSHDQGRRYSNASGDMNPIHYDKVFAQTVDLPDIILQGLCTMAFATQALTKGTNTQPTQVQRVRTRFSNPVFMGDILTTTGWFKCKSTEGQIYQFETRNQHDVQVLSDGEIEFLS